MPLYEIFYDFRARCSVRIEAEDEDAAQDWWDNANLNVARDTYDDEYWVTSISVIPV